MKKTIIAFTVLLVFGIGFRLQAQENNDYFIGKWKTVVFGTPNGDATMIFDLVRMDGNLTGKVILSESDSTVTEITSIEEKENSVSLFFSAGGYDVSLFLEKKDENHVTGSLMGMFTAEGERLKSNE